MFLHGVVFLSDTWQNWWLPVVRAAIAEEVSDIHVTAGQAVWFRHDGVLHPFAAGTVPTEARLWDVLVKMLTDDQRKALRRERSVDFSWVADHRRFRGNAYFQQDVPALALRLLPARIPTLKEIGAPESLADLTTAEHGLILVTGKVGAGKTTTLAAFLDAVNHSRTAHIVTLEDPIEYIYTPDQCFISQRELGRDFLSFAEALRNALREAPDIVLVGEIRDAETMRTAMMAAETGTLVLGTLHTARASEAALRIAGMFPVAEQETIRAQLAEVLLAVFAQRLIPAKNGGRVATMEVLLATPAVRSLIRQGKYAQLDSTMLARGGMQTGDMDLDRLYEQGEITRETREKYRSQPLW